LQNQFERVENLMGIFTAAFHPGFSGFAA
jgi:hypothetical protein